MRVSSLIAFSSFLLAVASADQVLEGRLLHGNPGETKSNYYTEVFNQDQDSHATPPTFEGGYQLGLILGFATTAAFMIFAIITLIYDEYMRHVNFKLMVMADKDRLKTRHNVS